MSRQELGLLVVLALYQGLLIRLSKPEASPAEAAGPYTSPSWRASDARQCLVLSFSTLALPGGCFKPKPGLGLAVTQGDGQQDRKSVV